MLLFGVIFVTDNHPLQGRQLLIMAEVGHVLSDVGRLVKVFGNLAVLAKRFACRYI